MNKAEELQTLMDITLEEVNEHLLGYPDMTALEIFENSVKNAVAILIQIRQDTQLPSKKQQQGSAKVDKEFLAFQLQDNETVAVILGGLEFAEAIDLDYIEGIEAGNDNED